MNQELQFLQNIFNAESQSINLLIFGVQILLTAILSLIISHFYIRYGNSLSNRRALSRNFVLIGITTMLIITIVKSSLALSLGLVGALSIVRFRTAIKEPEELAYFFMVIAIGLGIGAGQILATVMGTFSLCGAIFLIKRQKVSELSQNLIISIQQPKEKGVEEIIKTLEEHCSQLELRRLDENPSHSEISFAVTFKSVTALLTAKNKLQEGFPDVSFSFLEMV